MTSFDHVHDRTSLPLGYELTNTTSELEQAGILHKVTEPHEEGYLKPDHGIHYTLSFEAECDLYVFILHIKLHD